MNSTSRYLLVAFALAYGTAVILLDGRPLTQLYEPSPFHRYQADAILQGRFYLADSLDALTPGLVWHNGHIQHVWGLGVGFWLTPFEIVWRVLGGYVFPDRIALFVAIVLFALYTANTGVKLSKTAHARIGLGLMWVVLLCPAIWTLARSTKLIFEETVLYAIVISLTGLVSIVRVAVFTSRSDYALCCILAAISIWVRPTHAIYGLTALIICTTLVWMRRHCLKEVILGIGSWVVSVSLLLWANDVRFGSPMEFGHQLTVTTEGMVYLTRFGNPFKQATMLQAAMELFGLLFLASPSGAPALGETTFIGQADVVRWRRLDLTSYDLSYVVIALIGISVTISRLCKRNDESSSGAPRNIALALSILCWSASSIAGLCFFYLYYPVVASRYLLDFAPALTAFALLPCILLRDSWNQFYQPLLATWLICQILVAKVPVEKLHEQLPLQRSLVIERLSSLIEFNGHYTIEQHPTSTSIACNGSGWEAGGGFASDVVILAIDSPKFLELRVSPRRERYGEVARTDVYRARIDRFELPLASVLSRDDEQLIKFEIPKEIREREKMEILFLCFSESYDAIDRNSERFLYQVRWR